MRLAAESSTKQLEAELAVVQRDATQAVALHKSAAAAWQARLDAVRAEVGTCSFDLAGSLSQ